MRILKLIATGVLCLFYTGIVFSQQLKLGKNPYTVQKSAVLELNSDNQGLLLVRIADTTSINLLSPPDGMVIYFIPTKQLFVRSNSFWKAMPLAESLNSYWSLAGNTTGTIRKIGSTDAYDVSYITSNAERLRMTSTGNIGIGTSTFDGTNAEKLLIDAGTTTSYNLVKAKGTINNYLQLNLQNQSAGTAASSDIVATANNGTETTNYIDMGINSAGFTDNTYPVLNGINNAYLYSTGNDFLIGNATAAKNLRFFTGGYATTNERMRIDGNGNLGIGATTFDGTYPEKVLIDAGTTTSYNLLKARGTINSYLQLNLQNQSAGTAASSDIIATANNGSSTTNYVDMGITSGGFTDNTRPILNGINNGYLYSTGNDFLIGNGTAAKSLRLFTGGYAAANERMRIEGTGDVAIGATTFDGTNPEQLLIDAGTTTSYNLLKARGTINNYLQLNLQNQSAGTAASSDIVATANNGTETTNYIDMGINSGGFTDNTYPILNGINNAYLYSTGNDFLIGNAIASKNIRFFTGGYATTNERMRIDGSGNVGIGVTTTPAALLEVNGTSKMGAKGTVTKNIVSFSNALTGTVTAGAVSGLFSTYSAGVLDVTITIPTANQPTTTQATVSVSPSADLPASVSVAWARLSSTTQVKIRFLNASTTAQALSGNVYITITEF